MHRRIGAWIAPGRAKRGRANCVFVTWKGNHSPRHVHAYREGKLVLKWDLENRIAMKGNPTRRKSAGQLLSLLYFLDCEVELVVRMRTTA